MRILQFSKSQKGIVNIPILLIAIVAIIGFLFVSSNAPLKDRFLGSIYPKDSSHASVEFPSDINSDGIVNITDFSILLSKWNSSDTLSDLNKDGKVNILDFSMLLTNWGQRPPSPSPGSQNSMAMGKWNPNTKYDTCPNAADTAKIKEIHDSYFVLGPDGKKYPTWHPPVDPQTGCKFGHDHGRDPSKSMVWQQVKEYFYFDENKNGVMDSAEEAKAGLPFGYVNEQYDAYNAANGVSGMRHEDHVGHKVDWANDETDVATHNQSTAKNAGVWVGDTLDGGGLVDSGVRCFYLSKPHQGVSTPDAFTNNIHEVFYFADCKAPNSNMNEKISLALMEGFGAPGGFTNFMPLCNIARRSDPQDLLCPLGKDSSGKCIRDSVNQNYPAGNGDREIITRQCVEEGFLVPNGSWSGNLYEAWPASLEIQDPSGRNIVSGINLLFDVNDANRYYYPESMKTQRGYNNPEAKTNLGFTMDLCYDTSVSGRKYRGGACDIATDYGNIKDIKWDDPRSAFKGLSRGMYFQPALVENAGGVEYWYSDPFGKNASKTPFQGSVKQQITAKNINYAPLISTQIIDPRVIMRVHDDGNKTVHAPN